MVADPKVQARVASLLGDPAKAMSAAELGQRFLEPGLYFKAPIDQISLGMALVFGTAGLPHNLAILHSPLLTVVAVRYWARTMRSPAGELCFAAHSRHAEAEMRALGRDMSARITTSPALTELLSP